MIAKNKYKKDSADIKFIHSPYLNARREWNERYGDYIQQAKTWRIVGLIGLLIGVISTGGTIYFAGQNKLIPYVVEVDARGNTVAVYESTAMQPVDTRIVRAQLAQIIRDLRTISADKTVQKNAIRRLYSHLGDNSQATNVVNQYFRENDPFVKAQKKTVAVDIQQLLPLSDNTWQIEWSEQEYGRDGKILGKNNYTATATVSIGNTVNEQTILFNPIGMYVTDLHLSHDFKVKTENNHSVNEGSPHE